jgi:uncharacterized protein DUF1918
MYAKPGDWLLVQSSREATPTRYGEILAAAAGGAPPYTVHWVDTGRTGLVFPGPDAVVISADRRAEIERQQLAHAARVQAEISARRPTDTLPEHAGG